MAEDNLWEVEDIPIENKGWLYHMGYEGIVHTIAAPACDVFYVRVNCNSFAEGKTCEIYGEIMIEDDDGTSYELYCRDPDDAETLSREDNTLSIDIPTDCAASSAWVRMRICLKDKVDGSLILNEVFSLDEVTKVDDYDRVEVRQVCGVGGSATVSYCRFLCANVAFLEITLKCDGLPAAGTDNLYGTIVARYGNTYGKKFPGIMLFNKPPNQSSQAVSKIPIELSRDVVAVPAYSFLRIDVDLSDSRTNQPVVNGKADFLASLNGHDVCEIGAGDCVVKVNVHWLHPFELENEVEKPSKLFVTREPSLGKHCALGFSLIEVFTVMICHDSNSVLNICGTIAIRDGLMTRRVFNRNKSNPETLFDDSKTIPIVGPSECFDGPEGFFIQLDLWDVQGRVLIKGMIPWSPEAAEWPILWYDRRICSVSLGVHGYAAVFYTIFSRAVQALVKASFISNGSTDVSHHVRGTIVAKYRNKVYSTEYERAYYQSVLFKKLQGNSLELTSGCTVPLLKSVVAVPTDDSLIVEVDLYASPLVDGFPEEHLKGVARFDIGPGTCISPVIEGKNCGIELSVEWSKLYKLYEKSKLCKLYEKEGLCNEYQ